MATLIASHGRLLDNRPTWRTDFGIGLSVGGGSVTVALEERMSRMVVWLIPCFSWETSLNNVVVSVAFVVAWVGKSRSSKS